MRAQKISLIAFACLVFGLTATILVAQQAHDDFSAGEVGAGANLVVTSLSGPATAIHGQTISVTYTVKNQGTVASGSYNVALYLSTDKTIDPAADRLVDKLTFSTGLEPGVSKKTTTKVLVPMNGLSGNYYYGAVVASSKKASSKQVSLVRYSLGEDNDTVKDHQTGYIWQRADDGVLRDWADAYKFCGDLGLGDKTDWRLPNIDELETIIDYSRIYPAIDPVFSCKSEGYWSSSTYLDDSANAWYVGFGHGGVHSDGKTNVSSYVRCLRSGPVTVPADTVPGAPTGVTATAGNTQATISFSPPASDGGSPIISYTVTSTPGGIIATGASIPITVPGLTNGTAYTFTVKATNAIGTGPASSPSNSVTPVGSATVPGAPTGVTAIAGNAQATVSFTVPASDGGSPIISYTVTSSPGGRTRTAASRVITVTGLTNGTAYTFTVRATNSIGKGPASSPSNSVTPVGVPGAPTGVTAIAGNAQATVSFMPPASDGGKPIISYTVTSSPGGLSASGAGSPITMTGLTNWTAYTFTVKATNSVGTGPGSSSNRVTPVDPAAAFSVSGRVATSGGTGIAGVTLTFVPISGSIWVPGAVTTDSNGNWSQSGFASGYTYRVTPSKDETHEILFLPGSKDFIATQSDLNFTFKLRFLNNWDGTVTDNNNGLMWQQAYGGSRDWDDAGKYCDDLVLGGHDDWRVPLKDELLTILVKENQPTIDPVFECRSLGYWTSSSDDSHWERAWVVNFEHGTVGTNNKTYSGCYVRCVRGAWLPGAPTGVTAIAGNAQATVDFTVPASDGGSPIISYTVTSSPGGITATGATSPITVTGLINWTAYTFTVTATNAVGTGPTSSASNSVIPVDPAAAFSVSGRVATSGGTGIAGVTLTFVPISGSIWVPGAVTTDSNGNWSQSGFAGGYTYRVTPGGYFLPGSMDFNAARSDLNFTARYFSNGDGTVTDNTTQLMWQKGDDGTERNWADAGQYCANLILAGHDDWRLPLVGELGGLLPVGPFFGCRPAPYWTSSTYDLDPGAAWYVDFINEDWQGPGWATKTHKYYVLCVRGGP